MKATRCLQARASASTGPYFYNGSVTKLEDAVRYMAGSSKPDPNKSPIQRETLLGDGEVSQVVAFLKGLTSTETWEQSKLP